MKFKPTRSSTRRRSHRDESRPCEALPADVRAAVDALSGDAWVEQFGPLWDKWGGPVREGAKGPGHEVIVPGPATMTQWRDSLKLVSDRTVEDLGKGASPGAGGV